MSTETLPHDKRAEMAVLGSAMQAAKLFVEIVNLPIEVFWIEAHRIIFKVMLDLFHADKAVDMLTISSELKRINKSEQVGGDYYLTEMVEVAIIPRHIKHYTKVIKKKYQERQYIQLLAEAKTRANNPSQKDNPEWLFENLTNIMVSEDTQSRSLKELAQPTLDGMLDAINDMDTGIITFRKTLDDTLGRWRPGSIILLAAESGGGKSALAIEQAYIWAKHGVHVGFVSIEMTGEENMERMVSIDLHKRCDTTVPYMALNTGSQQVRDGWQNIEESLKWLNDLPLFIIDDKYGKAITTTIIKAEFIKLKAKAPEAKWVFVIDYAQLIKPTGKSNNREQQVANISREIKSMANALQAPVLVLTQLNKSKEYRTDTGKPTLDSIRESSALAHDAHKVIAIWRKEKSNDGKDTRLIVMKNRGGKVGSLKMDFLKPVSCFDIYSKENQIADYNDKEENGDDLPF